MGFHIALQQLADLVQPWNELQFQQVGGWDDCPAARVRVATILSATVPSVLRIAHEHMHTGLNVRRIQNGRSFDIADELEPMPINTYDNPSTAMCCWQIIQYVFFGDIRQRNTSICHPTQGRAKYSMPTTLPVYDKQLGTTFRYGCYRR
jgi:hypothetical protein